jgi:DNA-binding response OmpR family regulator
LAATLRNAPAGSPSALVIEDDPQERAWLSDTLARAGYEVRAAETGAEALQRCRERSFDVITLDLLLPDTNGWDVWRAIRSLELHEHTPVLVVSVVADKDLGFGFAVQDILLKPVNAEALVAAVHHAVSPRKEAALILIVEDDGKALKVATRALTTAGYRVLTERDGERGLRARPH